MIFKKSGPQEIRAMITKFETELTDTRQTLEEVDQKIVETSIAIEEGAPGAADSLAKWESQREKLAANANRLEKTLLKVNEKYHESIVDEQRAAIEKRWKDCAGIVKERTALAESIVEEATSVIKKLNKLKETGAKLYELAPAKDLALTQSHLGPTAIDNHFKFLLLSLGCHWANYWAWGDLTIPKFMEQTNEGNAWILAQKDRPSTRVQKVRGEIVTSQNSIGG